MSIGSHVALGPKPLSTAVHSSHSLAATMIAWIKIAFHNPKALTLGHGSTTTFDSFFLDTSVDDDIDERCRSTCLSVLASWSLASSTSCSSCTSQTVSASLKCSRFSRNSIAPFLLSGCGTQPGAGPSFAIKAFTTRRLHLYLQACVRFP